MSSAEVSYTLARSTGMDSLDVLRNQLKGLVAGREALQVRAIDQNETEWTQNNQLGSRTFVERWIDLYLTTQKQDNVAISDNSVYEELAPVVESLHVVNSVEVKSGSTVTESTKPFLRVHVTSDFGSLNFGSMDNQEY